MLEEVDWTALPDWASAGHEGALAAFQRSCATPTTRPDPWQMACEAATASGMDDARRFFETWFTPKRLDTGGEGSLLTGYFEPELPASRTRTDRFSVPILAFADDLDLSPTRGDIMDGALKGAAAVIAYLDDPIEAFFVHVQGSARLLLRDGTALRIGYAGRNDHAYRSVGREMRRLGLGPDPMTAEGMKAWLRAHPEEADRLLRHNPSYIFFRQIEDLDPDLGPVGAQGVQLTPRHSLAIDPEHHFYGLPIFLDAMLPIGDNMERLDPFRELMIAQDTGSAIVGPARGDIFWGSGAEAGEIAGRFQHPGTFYVLVPQPR
ncbi:MAG: MltA domain-containing protein [Pseudomonadota bacterium]